MNICFQKTNQRVFGTFPLTGEVLAKAIHDAVSVGYRAFDTAQAYGNEADTGAALQSCGIARDDLCITTKVRPENYGQADFLPSVEQSLRDLRIDRADILLLHWPDPSGDIAPALLLLEQAQRAGLTAHIGVSNFTAAMMRRAVTVIETPLVTNQVEFHPLLNQNALLAAATQTGIPLSSYCSVARGEVFKYPLLDQIAASYGKSAAQIVLRWILQKGLAINTMSTKRDNIAANFDVMDFTLSSVDMDRIWTLTSVGYRVVTKALVPIAPDWD